MATLPKMNYNGIRVQNLYYNGQEIYNLTLDGQVRYHKHRGNKNTGGGCYTVAVQHRHQGNSSTNGGCYTIPVYHEHTGNCYPQKTIPACHWGSIVYPDSTVPGVEKGDYWTCTCSCGEKAEGSTKGGISVTPGSIHKGERTEADRTQNPICGKTENVIDHYDVGCGKSETTIEYSLGCGFDET